MSSGQRHRPTKASRRPLSVEALEARDLLAVAAFSINLYADEGGLPGGLIEDEAIEAGDSFFAEITAREFDPLVTGLQRVALDIAWDPSALHLADTTFQANQLITPDLPMFITGTLNADSGSITDLGGSAFPAWNVGRPIGDGSADRFALLHFRALDAAGESSISLAQGKSAIATMPVSSLTSSQIRFEQQSITIVPTEQPLLPQVTEQGPEPSCDLSTYLSVQIVYLGPLPPDGLEGADVTPPDSVAVTFPPELDNCNSDADLLFVGPRAAHQLQPFFLRLEEIIDAIAAEVELQQRQRGSQCLPLA